MHDEPQRPQYKKKTRKKRRTRDEWTLTEWKDHVWKAFSYYIRLRDCLLTTGTTTHGRCATCGRTYPFKQLQAGHFMPGRLDFMLFDEGHVNAQCKRCNVFQSGMWPMYFLRMEEKLGYAWIAEQLELFQKNFQGRKTKQYSTKELQALEALYVMQSADLEAEHLRKDVT